MSLILRTPWTRQPQGVVGVDWGHPLARGLVAWLPGNGYFYDATRRASVTLAGNPQFGTYSDGRLGALRAPAWDGTDDEVSFGTFPLLKTFSLLAWWYEPSTPPADGYRAIIRRGNVFGTNANFVFGGRYRVDSSEPRFFCFARNSGALLGGESSVGGNMTQGAWNRIGVAWHERRSELYLNGRVVATFTNGEDPGDSSDPLAFGGLGDSNNGTRIATAAFDARVYNRVLSDGEFAADYAGSPYAIFAPRRIWVPVSAAGGGVSGTLAYTNAADTLSASGTTTVTGTSSTTNAADTSAASGTTTVVGTSSTTNAADTSSASGTTTVTGTLATTNANDTLAATGSVGSDVTGTLAYTNADDTSAAAGTTTVVGTSSTTNAADTSAAAGTTTVTGTVAYTNENDTLAASGVAGAITGTLAYTNADDTLAGSGPGGPAAEVATGAPGPRFRRVPYVVFIDGKRYIGTEEEIRALIEAFAEEQAEKAVVKAKAPKKPRIVVEPGKTVEGRVFKEMAPAPKVAQQAISVQTDMRRLYAEVYARIIAQLEEDEEESLISLL